MNIYTYIYICIYIFIVFCIDAWKYLYQDEYLGCQMRKVRGSAALGSRSHEIKRNAPIGVLLSHVIMEVCARTKKHRAGALGVG